MKKIAFLLIILVASVGGFFIYNKVSLVKVIREKNHISKIPELYVIPIKRNLEASKFGTKSGTVYSVLNISFRVPWKTSTEKVEMDSLVSFSFDSKKGKGIIFYLNQDNCLELLKEAFESDLQEYRELENLFKQNGIKSDFDIYNLILSTSPNQVNIFTPMNKIKGVALLLLTKSACLIEGDVIYRFQGDSIQGFQFGDPEKDDVVTVHFFDYNYRFYRMKFFETKQREIDYIISSIKIRTYNQ